MIQHSLFDSFFAPTRVIVVSEERLQAAEREARVNHVKAIDCRIEELTKYRNSIDKQLKAAGYDGLWPEGEPPNQSLMTGRTPTGERIEDPDGARALTKHAFGAFQYPGSADAYSYGYNMLVDADGTNRFSSVWDDPEFIKTGEY